MRRFFRSLLAELIPQWMRDKRRAPPRPAGNGRKPLPEQPEDKRRETDGNRDRKPTGNGSP